MRIALCGEARSGKDTVASLCSGFISMAFGDYMKVRYYKDNPHKVGKPKDREHMIAWSQPQVNEYPRIWVDKLEEDFNRYHWSYGNNLDVIITDLRQPHEEEWCRENGFHIVRVHANETLRAKRAMKHGEFLGKDLPYEVKADFHIYNDGSLRDLKNNVKQLLRILVTYDKIKSDTNKVNKSYAKNSNYFN